MKLSDFSKEMPMTSSATERLDIFVKISIMRARSSSKFKFSSRIPKPLNFLITRKTLFKARYALKTEITARKLHAAHLSPNTLPILIIWISKSAEASVSFSYSLFDLQNGFFCMCILCNVREWHLRTK